MTWPYNYWVPCWYIVLISELGDVGNETEQTIHGTTFWRWKTQILPQIWGSLLMTVWNPSDAERVTWIYLETSDVLLSTVPIVRLGLDPFTQDCNLYHLNELFVLRLTAKEVLVLLRNTCRELFFMPRESGLIRFKFKQCSFQSVAIFPMIWEVLHGRAYCHDSGFLEEQWRTPLRISHSNLRTHTILDLLCKLFLYQLFAMCLPLFSYVFLIFSDSQHPSTFNTSNATR